jgi:hypothetical protein
MRIDLGNRAGSYGKWWIAGPSRAVAWHYLKYDEVSTPSLSPCVYLETKLICSLILKRTVMLFGDLGGGEGNTCGFHQGSIGI